MCTLDSVVVYSFIFSVFLHHCCWKEIYCKQFKNINSGYWYVAINCSLEWKSKKKKKKTMKLSPWFSQFFTFVNAFWQYNCDWKHILGNLVILYVYQRRNVSVYIGDKLPTALVKLKVQYMCICLWWAICLLKN